MVEGTVDIDRFDFTIIESLLNELVDDTVILRMEDHVADVHAVEADVLREHLQTDLVVVHDVELTDLTELTEGSKAIQ